MINLLAFWTLAVISQFFIKYGCAGNSSRWWWGFVLGNTLGILSAIFLMKVYERMDPNLAFTLAAAGGFILTQVGLNQFFGGKLCLTQWMGLLIISAGMCIVGMNPPKS